MLTPEFCLLIGLGAVLLGCFGFGFYCRIQFNRLPKEEQDRINQIMAEDQSAAP